VIKVRSVISDTGDEPEEIRRTFPKGVEDNLTVIKIFIDISGPSVGIIISVNCPQNKTCGDLDQEKQAETAF
jgi:hypothetical protein